MRPVLTRLARLASLLAILSPAVPATAQKAPGGKPVAPVSSTPATTPWLYRGSDIPPDRAWVFGELPNGLRYAVRRNGVPPHQVSIRVAIDAGSLMERPGEEGFAHFNEHLSFRGSRYVPDGEAKRVFQRLGATFGSDTNAATTPTQTVYKLDLPDASRQGLDDAVRILSGMMAAPDITPAEVAAERRTVLAELREGNGPQGRVSDATRALFFAGQPLGDHATIGTVASLNAATQEGLRAFHDRWYRPSRAVVVIAGDADPAVFEALIKHYFSDWRATGPDPAEPGFGDPKADAPRTSVLVEPGLPQAVNLAVVRPWRPRADTIVYNRGKLVDALAMRIINRRLERRARAGGSFLLASMDQDDISRSVDATTIGIVPLTDDWRAAVRDVRAVIADALVHPPGQAEIDREADEFAAALTQAVETSVNDPGSELADTLVEAVNIRETVASDQVARDVFANMKGELTPAAILASTKKLMTGTPMRALLTVPRANPQDTILLTAALTADVRPGPAQAAGRPVSFAMLPKFGPPATVIRRASVPSVGVEFVELSNGVRLALFPLHNDVGRIYVAARFGAGIQALPSNRPSPAWAASAALVPSGIGDLGQEEIDRLTSARRIGMSFDIGDDAFSLRGVTRPADLPDQLRLLAAKLLAPGWDPNPVLRARAAFTTGQATMNASPNGVLGRDLQGLLHAGDPRWTTPTPTEVAALTPAAFRAFWAPLLATGPIELSIYGDFDPEKAIVDAAATFGALPPRRAPVVLAGSDRVATFRPTSSPVVRYHSGPKDQAAAVIAWPTGGGVGDVYESRKLEILAQIFGDRLFDQLREGEGASYSPDVSNNWPRGLTMGGSFIAASQLTPAGVDNFFTLAERIANDLATKPVTADELARSVGPMRQLIARQASGSGFWFQQLAGASTDPRRIAALTTISTDFARINPADLQATAQRWLVREKEFRMVVLPEKK